jgi:hypothetical protein
MSGRGELGREDRTAHPRVLSFNADNQWELAVEPLMNEGKCGRGVGPGLAFGKAMVSHHSDGFIGLIPCAVAGSSLKGWERGGDLYFNAIHRVRLAMHKGELAGALWHGGESESEAEASAMTYGDRLAVFIRAIRRDVGVANLPIVVGQLGQFFCEQKARLNPFAQFINETLAQLPARVPQTASVSSENLQDAGDGEHFDAASQRELGRRFAHEMVRLMNRQEPEIAGRGILET